MIDWLPLQCTNSCINVRDTNPAGAVHSPTDRFQRRCNVPEPGKRFRAEGIIGLGVNPGNLKSELFRNQGAISRALTGPANYPIVNGAYTELWAALSPEVTLERVGSLVFPFGRFGVIRRDWEKATRPESEGGNGTTQKFWEWSEEQVRKYV